MKPALLKGTRDFGPKELLKREFIFNIIRECFSLFGYAPLETPAMESMATLTGKYGEEGDRLLFRILNNGDFLADVPDEHLKAKDSKLVSAAIAKRGLRYDLTVPFARYVVMNQTDISFPFKRYQIQPVWRADRPQKGRYQEFYQCDADVVGSDSLWYEAELLAIYARVFSVLKLPVIIKYNNRKILQGLAEAAGVADRFQVMTILIDKIDKIGMDGVIKEMTSAGFPDNAIDYLSNTLKSVNSLDELKLVMRSDIGMKGIEELAAVEEGLKTSLLDPDAAVQVKFDITLARGLGYYTGFICEVVAGGDVQMGSIGGGGRYDNLTGVFGLPNVSGVGISFGAERIYDVMEELGLWPKDLETTLQVMILTMDTESFVTGTKILALLRNVGINSDIYPSPVKFQKQIKYANDKKVPYVIVIGPEEIAANKYALKNMRAGTQVSKSIDELIGFKYA